MIIVLYKNISLFSRLENLLVDNFDFIVVVRYIHSARMSVTHESWVMRLMTITVQLDINIIFWLCSSLNNHYHLRSLLKIIRSIVFFFKTMRFICKLFIHNYRSKHSRFDIYKAMINYLSHSLIKTIYRFFLRFFKIRFAISSGFLRSKQFLLL